MPYFTARRPRFGARLNYRQILEMPQKKSKLIRWVRDDFPACLRQAPGRNRSTNGRSENEFWGSSARCLFEQEFLGRPNDVPGGDPVREREAHFSNFWFVQPNRRDTAHARATALPSTDILPHSFLSKRLNPSPFIRNYLQWRSRFIGEVNSSSAKSEKEANMQRRPEETARLFIGSESPRCCSPGRNNFR